MKSKSILVLAAILAVTAVASANVTTVFFEDFEDSSGFTIGSGGAAY